MCIHDHVLVMESLVSSPLMILVQKITLAAYALHDGELPSSWFATDHSPNRCGEGGFSTQQGPETAEAAVSTWAIGVPVIHVQLPHLPGWS